MKYMFIYEGLPLKTFMFFELVSLSRSSMFDELITLVEDNVIPNDY